MLESMLNAFRAPDIRRRILFVLAILVVYRALAHVLIPGINVTALNSQSSDNSFFGLLSLFSGGDVRRMSIVGLGLNPYINATIIMQILQSTIPSLQALSREGEYGRNKITSYSRMLSVPLAALQAYGILALVQNDMLQDHGSAGLHEPVQFRELPEPVSDPGLDRRLHRPDVAGRVDHREGDRQRHQLHHLCRHRVARPGRGPVVPRQPGLAGTVRSSASSAWSSSS